MSPRARLCAFLLVLAAAGYASGCASEDSGSCGRLGVVATTTQLGDVVGAIGGGQVDLHQILRPNTDPHEYEPRPDDVRQTAGAKLVFLNGDGLDAWMGKVVDQSGGHPRAVDLGSVVPDRIAGDRSGPEASRYDPHWWHDPRNMIAAVAAIRRALDRADPQHATTYDRRATAYTARLRTLDRGIARCFARVPRHERRLVTSHDAFGTFAHRYGIAVVGAVIGSQTTEAQPSAGSLARLARTVRREGVKAIFPETSVSPKLARALAEQTGARADLELYGDTLGPRGSAAGTYLGMERVNADRIMTGFTGSARGCASPR